MKAQLDEKYNFYRRHVVVFKDSCSFKSDHL
ncbi:hypothetical protein DFR58_10448 [Anaerobacterium chartisolvens]|uniref:Uncharacterized protein n=1 Tax=Anaerobacterium chartisolvens TaxID=1297424 RepID=A0A369BB70_9FIRM|nr:hypothetical protein DFR58_10448 [Anaerobacterium chartisolvens]